MPAVILPLADEYVTITRRVGVSLIRKVMETLSPHHPIPVYCKGENNQLPLWGSETVLNKSLKEHEDPTHFGQTEMIYIEIKEEETSEGYDRNTLRGNNFPPIWYHERIKTYVRPNYIQKKLTVSVSYKTDNMEEANWFRDRVTSLKAINITQRMFTPEYHICPDKTLIHMLKDLYDLEWNDVEEGTVVPDFKTWLDEHSYSKCLTRLGRIDGQMTDFAFKEKQADLVANILIQETPEKSKNDKGPGYEMTFDIEAYFEKPYNITLRYPIVVNNQMIPERMIVTPEAKSQYRREDSTSTELADALDNNRNTFYDWMVGFTNAVGVIVPLGDDWKKPAGDDRYSPVFTSLVPFTGYEEGEVLVGTIFDYEDYIRISKGLKEYIVDHKDAIFTKGKCPLYVEVYVNQNRIDGTNLRMDEYGDIYTTNVHITKWDHIHLTMGLLHRWNNVSGDTWKEFSKYPEMVEEMYNHYVYGGGFLSIDLLYKYFYYKYYTVPARGKHPDTVNDYINSQLPKYIWGQYPYNHKGISYQIINHILFGGKLSSTNKKYLDIYLSLLPDDFWNLTLQDQFRILIDLRYDFYLKMLELKGVDFDNLEEKEKIREWVYGPLDPPIVKEEISIGKIVRDPTGKIDEDTYHQLVSNIIGKRMITQMGAFVRSLRK